jgi:diguanylate cyclase
MATSTWERPPRSRKYPIPLIPVPQSRLIWTAVVSINISSKHFSHAGFIGHVKDALEASAVDPQCITIELTESLAMSDVAATGQTMSQLRTLGVKLSIDDFGTGYSSLSYLRRFPVDALKIDQSFVATMDAENYAIVKTIVGLARNLDLKVVAEGVETIGNSDFVVGDELGMRQSLDARS